MAQKWWRPGVCKTKVTEKELPLKGNVFLYSYFKSDGVKMLMRSPLTKKNELISYLTWTNLFVLNPKNHACEPH